MVAVRESKRAAERSEVKKCPVDTFLARGRFHRAADAQPLLASKLQLSLENFSLFALFSCRGNVL